MASGWDQIAQIDPVGLAEIIWPEGFSRNCWGNPTWFYGEQGQIVQSVDRNIETLVVAANKMGKDFVTGFIALMAFLRAVKLGLSCRVVTTSVKAEHLIVLWAEIARFITSARYPLLVQGGGPLVLMHMEIRKASEAAAKNPVSYIKGMVSESGEGLGGHHAEVTLAIGDEASGIEDKARSNLQGWAKRLLWIGNAWDSAGFFRKEVEAGDLLAS